MEPTVVRSDAVTDNQPQVIQRPSSQKLAYLAIMVVGGISIGAGVYARYLEGLTWLPEVCIAAGVAVMAPGILSYLYRRYMLEEIKIELSEPAREFKDEASRLIQEAIGDVTEGYRHEIALLRAARKAGLDAVFISRNEALEAFMPYLEEEKHDILIVGSSLRGLLQEDDQEYEHARRVLKRRKDEGVRVRFLVTHPRVADLRARQENRDFTDIGTETMDSIEILVDTWGILPKDIKLYMGTPTCFGVKTSRAMLLNPYPFMKEAYASPCWIARKPGTSLSIFALAISKRGTAERPSLSSSQSVSFVRSSRRLRKISNICWGPIRMSPRTDPRYSPTMRCSRRRWNAVAFPSPLVRAADLDSLCLQGVSSMRCIEVWLGDTRLCVAGSEQMESLHASLFLSNHSSEAHFSVDATVQRSEVLKESLRWAHRFVAVGDRITVIATERPEADAPEAVTSFGTQLHPTGKTILSCSFCGRDQSTVKKMFQGFGANACDECVEMMSGVLAKEA